MVKKIAANRSGLVKFTIITSIKLVCIYKLIYNEVIFMNLFYVLKFLIINIFQIFYFKNKIITFKNYYFSEENNYFSFSLF